jgi:hypothetical protein
MDSRNPRRALMGAAMACLLVGCASTPPDDESSPATPTVEPSMSTTATPPEAPSPPAATPATPSEAPSPPAATPADMGDISTWNVDFDHVGPLTIGLTVPELSALTGDAYEDAYEFFIAECLMGPVQATEPLVDFFWVAEGDAGAERLATIQIASFHYDGVFPRTADGLGLGSTLEEIQTVYGDALEYKYHPYEHTLTRVVVRRDDLAMVFDVPEGAGTERVIVGRYPVVLWPEGCH